MNDQVDEPKYDYKEACRLLGISRWTLYRLTKRRMIGFYKPPLGEYRYGHSHIQEFLRASEHQPSMDINPSGAGEPE